MYNTPETEAKTLLLNSFYLKKVVISRNYRANQEEPEYPHAFWHVSYFTRFEIDSDWKEQHSFDVDDLEEAVAHGIIGSKTSTAYEICPLPERLKKHWKYYVITVEEFVRRKHKWGETREDVRGKTTYSILTSKGWKTDFEGGGSNFSTALIFVAPQYYKMVEGGVPYHLSYFDVDEPDKERYPLFRYKGYYFKTKYFFPEQKCIAGESLGDDYYNDYENNNEVKVEVWDTYCFERDIVYVDGGFLIYNDHVEKLGPRNRYKLSGILDDGDFKTLRRRFPKAIGFNNHMQSTNWKPEE
jgi:hypothetical protein